MIFFYKSGTARPAGHPSTRTKFSTGQVGAYEYVSGGATPSPAPTPTPLAGDLNLDHIVNTLDFSLMNSKWLQNYSAYDLYVDGIINSLDYAVLKSNWGKTW